MPAGKTNAERQARYRARRLVLAGVRQINLFAPEAAHACLSEIARRTRAGEPLSAVLTSLAEKARARSA